MQNLPGQRNTEEQDDKQNKAARSSMRMIRHKDEATSTISLDMTNKRKAR